jgi:hypothetical protein
MTTWHLGWKTTADALVILHSHNACQPARLLITSNTHPPIPFGLPVATNKELLALGGRHVIYSKFPDQDLATLSSFFLSEQHEKPKVGSRAAVQSS